MDLYFLQEDGSLLIVTDAPNGYERDDGSTRIDPPPGVGYVYENGGWVKAPPPQPALGQSLTYKADVWRRATDAQAAVIDTELQKLDVRRRRMWDDAMYLDHADDLVVFFHTMLSQTFGAAEADRILAPSNV